MNAQTTLAVEAQLNDLFLPDTPRAIQEQYQRFITEAQEQDFGLLTESFVVLDTETTGLSFRSSELIEIAAARISGTSISKRFHTFVRPRKAIPHEIQKLTGISNDDVAEAPRAKQAVTELASFVEGMPVLAHNAEFDRHFVETVRSAPTVSDNWIDTLMLSRIALPCLRSHRLADLASAFHCSGVSHQASDDVEALCGVWRVILCGLSALPHDLLITLANMHEEVDWTYRTIFSYLSNIQRTYPPSAQRFDLLQIRKELVRKNAQSVRLDAQEIPDGLNMPTTAEIREEFSVGSTVSKMYESYECRQEQISMCEQVCDALATSTHLVVEAGTGVGKSIAYLLPLVHAARMNNITVGVATKTNALTDQLVNYELPALSKVIPGGVTFFSLKGFEHYPCLRRVMRACEQELPLDQVAETRRPQEVIEQDMLNALAVVLAMACQRPSGDLDGLGIRWKVIPRSMLSCNSQECERAHCPFFSEGCMVHGARRRAASADLVVTNHSLLLNNVEAEGNILPPIRHWVIDEAHSFEVEARRQWAVEISVTTCRALFEKLGGTRTGTISTLITQAAIQEGSTLTIGLLTKAASSLRAASLACADLFAEVQGLAELDTYNSNYQKLTMWISEALRATPAWQRVSQAGKLALEKLDVSYTNLQEAQAALEEIVTDPTLSLSDATCQLGNVRDALQLIIEGQDTSYVYSAALSRLSHTVEHEALRAEKIDIGYELSERWLPELMSVIFTSATLAVGHNFSHFNHSVGLDRLPSEQHYSVQLDSSYDFDTQMDVVVCKNLSDPRSAGYVHELEQVLYDIHVAMGGSVLTLFTNRREMEQVFSRVEPRLSEQGLEVAIQERRSSTRHIQERFIREKSLSLFALRSYWEGFDAGGDTLRCVVIPKLPFSNPQDPLVRERDVREERAWWHYSLPEAVLSVKQAAGRLIRTAKDSGILVLCDTRLITKGYGRAFLSSLQSSHHTLVNHSELTDYIAAWRIRHD